MYKIMVVEDEYHIRNIIKEYFSIRDIDIVEACNGYEALEYIDNSIDLILLDIMMPGIDGYEVCKIIREKYKVPILFLSALSEDKNQLLAFELGADDYITKPFKVSILLAKCKAIIKRERKEEDNNINVGHIQLDKINHILTVDGESTVLAHKEYELMCLLIKNKDRLLSRELILDRIWGYDYFGDGRAVDTYIKRLRKKLGKYSCYIQTVVKAGYMFKVVNDDEENF